MFAYLCATILSLFCFFVMRVTKNWNKMSLYVWRMSTWNSDTKCICMLHLYVKDMLNYRITNYHRNLATLIYNYVWQLYSQFRQRFDIPSTLLCCVRFNSLSQLPFTVSHSVPPAGQFLSVGSLSLGLHENNCQYVNMKHYCGLTVVLLSFLLCASILILTPRIKWDVSFVLRKK